MRYSKNNAFKVAITGMMLSLVLLFQFLERFMPFAETYMRLNISLIFIIATIYLAGFSWAFLILILRFIIGPAVGIAGYDVIALWSHFILFISGLTFILIFLGFKLLFKSVKKDNVKIALSLIIAVLISSFINAILNGVFYTPVYFWLYKLAPDASIASAQIAYKSAKIFFFGIPDYWAGIFAVYILGNLIKYMIISVLFVSIWKVISD